MRDRIVIEPGDRIPTRLGERRSTGIYVAEFPDRIKVGRGGTNRCADHRQAGAGQMVFYPITAQRTPDVVRVERLALRAVAHRATQIRRTESFTGLPFETVAKIVELAIEGHR